MSTLPPPPPASPLRPGSYPWYILPLVIVSHIRVRFHIEVEK